ncbi:FAD-dependent oxidoreductase [Geminisphaera colitermitum]|uniref:FAD-dependent oxidoreductase n=1 Tax=Geminisphaera colitermitum TaxID=1148786 RepID=UPI000158D351|nr:FAD-dependent oxidoreductase [Geminisphaera colitermitum]
MRGISKTTFNGTCENDENMCALLTENLRTPLVGRCDVFVCGGGPAGVAAAISAAREGASVTLVEAHGCLGGIWTSGCLCWLIDHANKTGIMEEIKVRLTRIGGLSHDARGRPSSAYDCECMKLILDEMTAEAGVRVLLHSHVVAARVNPKGRLTHAIVESKSGREAWNASVFIDASGDGDLAARAGCQFDIGHPKTGETQPMSLMALISGVSSDEIHDYHGTHDSQKQESAKRRLLAHLESHGHSPSYASPTLFHIRNNLFAMMATHQYGHSALSAADLTEATISARAEIHAIIAALRRSGGAWAGVQLVATAAQIGVREARRIRGRYTVTADDIQSGGRHPDSICDVTFCVDIHSTNPAHGKSYHNGNIRVSPYQIPLRAAIAADVDGLMLAGRCISGDFFAHASYRVTGNAVQMGESVGRAAAQASARGVLPRELIGESA